jgi:hypothetical protein
MKNLLSALFVILILTSVSEAQKKYDFLFVNFTAGPSIPIGEYASNDANNPGSGYAKVGIKGEIVGGINITRNISLLTEFFINTNSINLQTLNDKLDKLYPGYTWEYEVKKWSLYGGFAGLSLRTQVNKKISTFIYALCGYVNSTSPEIILTAGYPDTKAYYHTESTSTAAITYKLTTGLEYAIDKRFSICGTLDYIGSKPRFKNVRTDIIYYDNTTPTQTEYPTFDQSLSVFNIGIGFKYFIF